MQHSPRPPSEQSDGAAVRVARRGVLTGLCSASLLFLVPACGQISLPLRGPARGGLRGADTGKSALLLPLSGDSQALGQTLQIAATLDGGPGIGIDIIDSGSTPETAVAAARRAVDSGARMLVGPVFSAQAQAVARAVNVPVVTLSNDETLAGNRLFVLGVTPTQSTQAILSIAAQRNLRTVAVVVPPGVFGAQAAAAAQRIGPSLGLTMRPTVVQADAGGLLEALRVGGALPDAVYLPVADGTLAPFAEALQGQGMQLLGSAQWSAEDLSQRAAFRDAWYAVPDPLRFAAFDDAYTQASGARGGIISGLAFDGVELLRILGQTGQLSVRGLTRSEGFTGVIGPYRFLSSGLCERGLGVVRIGAGEFSLIGSTSV